MCECVCVCGRELLLLESEKLLKEYNAVLRINKQGFVKYCNEVIHHLMTSLKCMSLSPCLAHPYTKTQAIHIGLLVYCRNKSHIVVYSNRFSQIEHYLRVENERIHSQVVGVSEACKRDVMKPSA